MTGHFPAHQPLPIKTPGIAEAHPREMEHLMYEDAAQLPLVAKKPAIENHSPGGEETRGVDGCAPRTAGIQFTPENGEIFEEIHQDGLAAERRQALIPTGRYFRGEAKKSAFST